MKIAPLHPNSKYLFEIISQADGRKSEPFIATPNQVIDFIEKEENLKPEEMYINFLMDVGAVNECKPDESLSMKDMILSVPLFSGKAFRLMFRSPEALAHFRAGQNLSEYDESITDDDFQPVPDDQGE